MTVVYIYLRSYQPVKHPVVFNAQEDVLERTMQNYGAQVQQVADLKQLPAAYFLALIVLESSGRKMVPHRYEPHIHKRLREVKAGKRKRMEHVLQKDLLDAEEDALKNLASSWGPFQIMGYKCLDMPGVQIIDLRGNEAIATGIRWIEREYGHLLRAEKFKDAFHYHNTGRKYPLIGPPKTHSPSYVTRGLQYQKAFEKMLRANE